MDKLSSKSLKEQVYDHLRSEIHRHRLRPGSAIHMDEICLSLGISRTPLRDALLQLAVEGFVVISPRRGVTVNTLTRDDIRHSYQVIGALEGEALRTTVPRLSATEITGMRTLNDKMAKAIARGDFFRFYEHNLAFHDVYLRPCANPLLIGSVTNLKRRLYDFVSAKQWIREWEEVSIGEHERLVGFIEAGDAEGAATYVREVHWSFAVQEPFICRYYFPAGRAAVEKEKTP